MKRRLMLSLVTISLLFCASLLFADVHSKGEVSSLIKKVETRLDNYKEAGAEEYAGRELATIEEYIKKAKVELDNKDEDFAFYSISKADAYFKIIDAKKILLKAEKQFKAADRN